MRSTRRTLITLAACIITMALASLAIPQRALAQADKAAKPETKTKSEAKTDTKIESAADGASLHRVDSKSATPRNEVMAVYNRKQLLVLALVGSIAIGAFAALIGTSTPAVAAATGGHDAHAHH